MKNGYVIIVYILLVLGIPSFAGVHAGFRKAIDKGDITTAVNLRKAGVTDIYCPATMSSGDAVKLYENELRNSPEVLVENCEPGFLANLGALACNNPKNVKLCKQILAVVPYSKWDAILDKIIEKSVYDYASFTAEMNRGFSYEFRRIQNNPIDRDWTRPMPMDKMKKIASTASKSAVEVQSSIERDKAVALYSSQDGFLMESGCIAEESCSKELLVERYVEFSNIPDDMGLFFCHLHSGIDKKIEAEKGLNILNCEALFSAYSQQCSQGNKDEIRGIGLDHRQFQCRNTKSGWKWVPFGIKVGKTIWALWDNKREGTPNILGTTFASLLKAKYVERDSQAVQSYESKISDYLRHVVGDLRGGELSYYNTNFSSTHDKDAWYEYWKGYFAAIGNQYDFKEAKSSCPEGWGLPTRKQFEELTNVAGNGISYNDTKPQDADKWRFSLSKYIWFKNFRDYSEVHVDPYVMWLADGRMGTIWAWPDTVVYSPRESQDGNAYVRCVMKKR